MKKSYKTPLAMAMGATLLPLMGSVAHADTNPFALKELSAAYMQTAEAKADDGAAKAKEGACGEGKCGAAMMKGAAPAAADKKAIEGKCATNKPAAPAAPAAPATGGK